MGTFCNYAGAVRVCAEIIEENAKSPEPTYDDEMLEEELGCSIAKSVVLHYWSDGCEVQLECRIEYERAWLLSARGMR